MLGFRLRSAWIPRSVLKPRTCTLKVFCRILCANRPTNLSVKLIKPLRWTVVLLGADQPFLFCSKDSEDTWDTFLAEDRQFLSLDGAANVFSDRTSTLRISIITFLSKFLIASAKLSLHIVASLTIAAASFLFISLFLRWLCFLCLKALE